VCVCVCGVCVCGVWCVCGVCVFVCVCVCVHFVLLHIKYSILLCAVT